MNVPNPRSIRFTDGSRSNRAVVTRNVSASPEAPEAAQVPDAPEPEVETPGAAEIDQINRTFQSSNPEHRVVTRRMLFSDTTIDPRVQRSEVPGEINAIAKDFYPPALGSPTLSARVDAEGNETYVVLDGQQRRAAAFKVGYDRPVTFTVHYGLSAAEEAKLFRTLNFRRSVPAAVLFRTSLIEEDPTSLAIQNLCDSLGIAVGVPSGFNAVTLGKRLATTDAGLRRLRWALEEIQAIYDIDGKGGVYDGRVVEAFTLLYKNYEGRIKSDRLRKKLRELGDIHQLLGQANNVRSYRGGRLPACIMDAMVQRYNHNMGARGVNALPEVPRKGAVEEPAA